MYLAVNPEETLNVADKTDVALDDLAANFEVCDRAMEAAAALLTTEAPGVATSLRDVSTQEGTAQVKVRTAARDSTTSLREAVGDFARQAEWVRDGVVRTTETIGQVVGAGANILQQGAGEVQRIRDNVIDGAVETGQNVVSGAVEAGQNAVKGAVKAGGNAIDGVREVGETVLERGFGIAEMMTGSAKAARKLDR